MFGSCSIISKKVCYFKNYSSFFTVALNDVPNKWRTPQKYFQRPPLPTTEGRLYIPKGCAPEIEAKTQNFGHFYGKFWNPPYSFSKCYSIIIDSMKMWSEKKKGWWKSVFGFPSYPLKTDARKRQKTVKFHCWAILNTGKTCRIDRFSHQLCASFQWISRKPVDRFWWTLKNFTVDFKISRKGVQNFGFLPLSPELDVAGRKKFHIRKLLTRTIQEMGTIHGFGLEGFGAGCLTIIFLLFSPVLIRFFSFFETQLGAWVRGLFLEWECKRSVGIQQLQRTFLCRIPCSK